MNYLKLHELFVVFECLAALDGEPLSKLPYEAAGSIHMSKPIFEIF